MARQQRADLDFLSTNRIRNLPAPTNTDEPVRLQELNAAIEGLSPKDNARVATQANINLAAPGATVDGITMVVGDRFVARAQTSQPENGIYIWNGSAVAATRSNDASTLDELKSAIVAVDEGTDAGKTYRQTTVTGTIGTANIVWVIFGSGSSQATETSAGIAEILTQAEMDAGTDDQRIATALKIKNSPFARRSFSTTFGDGSATSFTITHNLNTRSVNVVVTEVANIFAQIDVEWRATTVNSVTILAAPAPTAGQFNALVTVI